MRDPAHLGMSTPTASHACITFEPFGMVTFCPSTVTSIVSGGGTGAASAAERHLDGLKLHEGAFPRSCSCLRARSRCMVGQRVPDLVLRVEDMHFSAHQRGKVQCAVLRWNRAGNRLSVGKAPCYTIKIWGERKVLPLGMFEESAVVPFPEGVVQLAAPLVTGVCLTGGGLQWLGRCGAAPGTGSLPLALRHGMHPTDHKC
jgi:hypothetical protein